MNIFKNKKANEQHLINFGFKQKDKIFKYSTKIFNGKFDLTVEITIPNTIKTRLVEIETNEIYTLHLTDEQGDFIGQVRNEYEKVLENIAKNCFDNNIFKFDYTYKVIDYALKKYGDYPEYLWEKFPDNAIIRRKDNSKWYIAILTVGKDKFGFKETERVEVIDLRAPSELVPELIERENIYKGYHMNKKHWISIILDGSIPIKEIYNFIDKSYELAK